MKKLAILLIVFFSTTFAKAQVTLNFESGNKAIDVAKSWSFLNIDYDKSTNYAINGTWAGKNTQISENAQDTWIKSPWVKITSGSLSFTIKLDETRLYPRGYTIIGIPNNKTQPNEEDSEFVIETKNISSPQNNYIQTITVNLPSNLIGKLYKIKICFFGQGSGSKSSVDDIFIPGEYYSDPANNGLSKVTQTDTDGDGVPDTDDAFPNDPKRAFKNSFPNSYSFGTLAFEDNWPIKADYDFNDVVVDYNLATTINSNNYVVDVTATFRLRATGAQFNNGFGFQLDGITPDKIEMVDNTYKITNPSFNYVVSPNNTESGQQYATCIVFDNCHKIIVNANGDNIVNTKMELPTVPHQTIVVKITFAPGAVLASDLNANTFNYFIIPNQTNSDKNLRAEIHLANRVPTTKADTKYFGKMDDNSNGSTVFYKTANNLPWGINVVQGFKYPTEGTPINLAYLHLLRWAETGGVEFPDWYDDSKPGYSDPTKLYK